MSERRPAPVVDRLRCSACGTWNDPERRPKGGQFFHINLGVAPNRYDGDGPQGCFWCGSPDWLNGADLGDMKQGFLKRSNKLRRSP